MKLVPLWSRFHPGSNCLCEPELADAQVESVLVVLQLTPELLYPSLVMNGRKNC
jgi:hypothetical protein